MKQGGMQPSPTGFTIVEVMIVLAISGVMLVSALALVSGRQDKTVFMTSIRNLQQQLQQVVNETASGYFPNNDQYSCSAASGQPVIAASGTPTAQGTNGGCVFLGKVVQFGASDHSGNFVAYSIAGNQSAMRLTGAAGAQPIAVASGTLPSNADVPDVYETHPLEGGMKVTKMYYNGSAALTTAGVGFIAGDTTGVYATAGGGASLQSGGQQLSLYALRNTSLGMAGAAMVDRIDAANAANFRHADSVSICVQSGTTDQVGLITIGGGGSQTAVSLAIKNGSVC